MRKFVHDTRTKSKIKIKFDLDLDRTRYGTTPKKYLNI